MSGTIRKRPWIRQEVKRHLLGHPYFTAHPGTNINRLLATIQGDGVKVDMYVHHPVGEDPVPPFKFEGNRTRKAKRRAKRFLSKKARRSLKEAAKHAIEVDRQEQMEEIYEELEEVLRAFDRYEGCG